VCRGEPRRRSLPALGPGYVAAVEFTDDAQECSVERMLSPVELGDGLHEVGIAERRSMVDQVGLDAPGEITDRRTDGSRGAGSVARLGRTG